MLADSFLYVAHAATTAAGEGHVISANGVLDLDLTIPRQFGSGDGRGTNPEQLFAAAYSASFLGAMKHVARMQDLELPQDMSIDATVAIGVSCGGFVLETTLWILVPGIPRAKAESLAYLAHDVCAYSRATRGNIQVRLIVV